MRRACAILLVWSALVALAAWAVGQAFSDRFVWSQPLSWMPAPLTAACAAGACVLSWVISRWSAWSRREEGKPHSRWHARGARARQVAGVGIAMVSLWTLGGEWNLLRAMLAGSSGERLGPGVSVLYWNHAGNWKKDWKESTSAKLADITFLSAPRYWEHMPELLDLLEREHGGRPHYCRVDRYAILSRWPVSRWGTAELGLPVYQTKLRPYATTFERGWYWNRGNAAWVEFASEADLGFNLIVRLYDMPSDPRLHREVLTSRAAEVLRAWAGPVMVRGPVGQWLAGEAAAGFPEPHLIVGDFNIPRDARSLRHLTSGFVDCFDEAGFGPDGTYPRQIPLLGIDQMFAGPALRTRSYDLFDPEFGTHLSQRAEFEVLPGPGGGDPGGVRTPAG